MLASPQLRFLNIRRPGVRVWLTRSRNLRSNFPTLTRTLRDSGPRRIRQPAAGSLRAPGNVAPDRRPPRRSGPCIDPCWLGRRPPNRCTNRSPIFTCAANEPQALPQPLGSVHEQLTAVAANRPAVPSEVGPPQTGRASAPPDVTRTESTNPSQHESTQGPSSDRPAAAAAAAADADEPADVPSRSQAPAGPFAPATDWDAADSDSGNPILRAALEYLGRVARAASAAWSAAAAAAG